MFLRKQEVELIDLNDGEVPAEQWFKIWCASGSNYAMQIEVSFSVQEIEVQLMDSMKC